MNNKIIHISLIFLISILTSASFVFSSSETTPISIKASDKLQSPEAADSIKSNWSNGNGKYVYFGEYEQNEGIEPIKWRVLALCDGKILLMSDKALDQIVFNEDDDETLWEKSNVRSWLNGTFFDSAFSSIEKSCILHSYKDEEPEFASVKNPALTGENVFLLSGKEVDTSAYGFFTVNNMLYTNESTKVDATQYAKNKGVFCEDNAAHWLTRSPSGEGVTYVGGGQNGGWLGRDNASNNTIGVVPAINLDYASISFVTDEAYDKNHPLKTIDDGNNSNSSFNLTVYATEGFTAKISSNSVVQGEKLKVTVLSLPKNSEEVGYTQISAIVTNSTGDTLAYGRIRENVELGDFSFDLPENLPSGEYRLMLFAEKLNSASSKNTVDAISNYASETITIKKDNEKDDYNVDDETKTDNTKVEMTGKSTGHPKTEDENNIVIWMVMMITALLSLTAIVGLRIIRHVVRM